MTLKKRILSGIFWQGLERIGSQGLSLVISIFLARLLAPEEFGILAIMLFFITVSNVFIDSGFSIAIIQKKTIDDIDCSTVILYQHYKCYWYYIVCFSISAPWIREFLNNDEITLYLRFSFISSCYLDRFH